MNRLRGSPLFATGEVLLIRRIVLLTAVASLTALAGPVLAQAADFTTPCTPQTFTVPAGVFSITIDAWGAQGGAGGSGGSGGLGGHATATISVTPGQVLQVIVGGQGVGLTAGCNGGGVGGDAVFDGGGGGGASDVRTGD